eukprot:scaffold2438_cov167-Amphora_coffeaeformis.AAC.21
MPTVVEPSTLVARSHRIVHLHSSFATQYHSTRRLPHQLWYDSCHEVVAVFVECILIFRQFYIHAGRNMQGEDIWPSRLPTMVPVCILQT